MPPEHQTLEYKESWKDDYLRWIAAFANARGGTLVIGRDDAGKVVGLANAKKLLEDLPNKVRDALGILVDIDLKHDAAGREFLEIRTEAHPYPVSYKGEYPMRSGSTTQVLKGAALDKFLLSRRGLSWDAVPEPGFLPKHCDAAPLKIFQKAAAGSGRAGESVAKDKPAALLENLELTQGEHLKRAACLLFAEDPAKRFTGAWIKIGFFASDDDLRYQDEVRGGLFVQVEKALELLTTKYLKAYIRYEGVAGLQRVERFLFPDAALREALLNAVVHKDYSVGTPVQISVYDDKIVFWNPGALPEGWSLKRLMSKHPSSPPNPLLANAFFRAGYIESWGRGIEKIAKACREHDIPVPEYDFGMSGLMLTFRANPKHLPSTGGGSQAVRPESDAATPQVTPQVTPPVTPPVTPSVKSVLEALAVHGALGNAELLNHFALKDRTHLRERYIAPALAAGLIERTIPEKPNSRLQKYRLTATGRAAAKPAR